MTIRVLVVEDDAYAAQTHAEYVGRVPGFALAGICRQAREAARTIADGTPADLLLLDLHLPDGHGLGLLRRLRAEGYVGDAIAVTSARDVDVVRHAVAQGVVLYLLKPFTFATFRSKLEQYAAYLAALSPTGEVAQSEIDSMLGALRSGGAEPPPKGMSAATLDAVTGHVRDRGPLSATETAALIGLSRVSARRYLEHLADTGLLVRAPRYGGSGRPEVEYRWAGR